MVAPLRNKASLVSAVCKGISAKLARVLAPALVKETVFKPSSLAIFMTLVPSAFSPELEIPIYSESFGAMAMAATSSCWSWVTMTCLPIRVNFCRKSWATIFDAPSPYKKTTGLAIIQSVT